MTVQRYDPNMRPNALGFYRIANGLEPVLKQVLDPTEEAGRDALVEAWRQACNGTEART